MKDVKKEPLISKIGYPLLRYVILGPILRFFWIQKIVGDENVPPKGAYLLASNHESYFDFLLITAALNRKIHFLAAEKFYENKIWKLIMNSVGSIRVDRYARVNIATYKEVATAIRRQRIIGIFPEGTRSPDGHLMRGKPGIAYMAINTGLPVIPAGLIGTYQILPKGQKIPSLTRAIIKFGKPLSFSHLKLDKNNENYLQDVTDEIMLKIAELTGEDYPQGDCKLSLKSTY